MAEFINNRMKNNVTLAGELISISNPREGVTGAGVPYVSCRGEIACSEDGSQIFSFRIFSKKTNASGSESKAYPKLRAGIMGGWVTREMCATNVELTPTKVCLCGGISQNLYVNQQGNLIEGSEYSITYSRDFKEYKAEIDLEAYVSKVQEEYVQDEPTGRLVYHLLSKDAYGNIIIVKTYAEGDINMALENADLGEGATSTYYIDITRREIEKRSTAIGRAHEAGSFTRKELMLVGALPAYIDDKAIEPAAAKTMMQEYENKKREVEAAGYQGNGGRSGMIGGRTTTATPAPTNTVGLTQPVDEDPFDIPF